MAEESVEGRLREIESLVRDGVLSEDQVLRTLGDLREGLGTRSRRVDNDDEPQCRLNEKAVVTRMNGEALVRPGRRLFSEPTVSLWQSERQLKGKVPLPEVVEELATRRDLEAMSAHVLDVLLLDTRLIPVDWRYHDPPGNKRFQVRRGKSIFFVGHRFHVDNGPNTDRFETYRMLVFSGGAWKMRKDHLNDHVGDLAWFAVFKSNALMSDAA